MWLSKSRRADGKTLFDPGQNKWEPGDCGMLLSRRGGSVLISILS